MSEQTPQSQQPAGGQPSAPFCPIDLPIRPTTRGKLGCEEEKMPLLLPAHSSASLPAKRGAKTPKAQVGKASEPNRPKPRRRVQGSHDLLLRGGPADQSKPHLLEETGEQLHPAPPLQRKPKKSKRHLDRVRRRQMNYLQIRRQQKRKRLLYNRLRLILKTCFAAFWVLVIWEIMHSGFWNFSNPQVTLHNAQWVQTGSLGAVVAPYADKPVYDVDPALIAADIKAAFPLVDSVHVRRRLFPARLELTMLEKTPWAAVYASEKARRPQAVITTNNQIIPLAPLQIAPKELAALERPLTRVILAPGQTLSQETLAQLHTLSYQLGQIRPLSLKSVDARDLDRVLADYAEVDVIVGRLDSEVSERLARLVPLAPRLIELKKGVGLPKDTPKPQIDKVDLRWSSQVTIHRGQTSAIVTPQELIAEPESTH